LKPGFFKNESLAECSPLARLLFAGLWCAADRAGRLEDRPKRIRAELLPYDDGSVDDLLTELHEAGFIVRYTAAGGRFIQVLNFEKHQNPHHRETESTIPAPDKPDASPGLSQGQPGASPEPAVLIPDSLIQGSGAVAPVVAGKPADPPPCPVEKIVELYHQHLPNNPRVRILNEVRKKSIRTRWREAARIKANPFGYTTKAEGLESWSRFFEVCSHSDFLTGKVPGRDGQPPFVADLDFLLSPKGFTRSLENKYHRGTE
jgi:hypothetical protein